MPCLVVRQGYAVRMQSKYALSCCAARMRSKDAQYISTCSGVRVAESHHLHPVPEQGGPVQGEDPLLLHQEPLPGLQG